MAKKGESKPKKSTRRRSSKKEVAKPQTLREKLESKPVEKKQSKKRGQSIGGRVNQWLQTPLLTHKASSSSLGEALTRQRSMLPKYVHDSWAEVRQITWPKFGQALRLTWAVLVFAVIFSVIVSILDWALSQLFNEFILNKSKNIIDFINDLF